MLSRCSDTAHLRKKKNDDEIQDENNLEKTVWVTMNSEV